MKKDIILKVLATLIDLAATWALPIVSEKLRSGPMAKEQREMIKEEVQSYLESH